jgi:hypothetical protein
MVTVHTVEPGISYVPVNAPAVSTTHELKVVDVTGDITTPFRRERAPYASDELVAWYEKTSVCIAMRGPY